MLSKRTLPLVFVANGTLYHYKLLSHLLTSMTYAVIPMLVVEMNLHGYLVHIALIYLIYLYMCIMY